MTAPPVDEHLKRGIRQFNRAHFFDAHESLEDAWNSLRGHVPLQHVRRQVQGLVQLAVAFHHQSTGNYVGGLSVLKRALRNLRGAEKSFPHLDFDRLRAELTSWQHYLEQRNLAESDNPREFTNKAKPDAAPTLPRIRRRQASMMR
jgi:predicted metal-dependent hydrolase